MENKQQTIKSTAAALTAVFLWASAFPAVRYTFNYYSPESVMLQRFIVASLTLAVISLIKKTRLPEKKDLPLFMFAGFIGIFLYMLLFNFGTSTVNSGVSSFLISSAPVHMTLLSILFLKEKVRLVSWVGIFISLGGLALVASSQMEGFTMNIGVVLLLAASIFTSGFSIMQRKLMQKYTPLEATTYPVFFGTLCMFVFLPTLITDFINAPITARLMPVYLGIFPAAIAYLSWSYALSKAKSTANVAMFVYLIPFVATLLAFVWLGETIAPITFFGGIVIIFGMLISSKLGMHRKN